MEGEEGAVVEGPGRVLQVYFQVDQAVRPQAGKQGWQAGQPAAAGLHRQRVDGLSLLTVPLDQADPALQARR